MQAFVSILLYLLVVFSKVSFSFLHQQSRRRTHSTTPSLVVERPVFVRTHYTTTPNEKLPSTPGSIIQSSVFLDQIFAEYGFNARKVGLTTDDLPVVCEIHDGGQWKLAQILSWKSPTKPGGRPNAIVRILCDDDDDENPTTKTIDIGQVTTIWNHENSFSEEGNEFRRSLQEYISTVPVKLREGSMEQMYNGRQRLVRSSDLGLSKKKLRSVLDEFATTDNDEKDKIGTLLRMLAKTGRDMVRVVDSETVLSDLTVNDQLPHASATMMRAACGWIISEDASLGGRFKRMPCTLLSYNSKDGTAIDSVTLVNGGWLAVDSSVRSSTEGRKFVERRTSDVAPKNVPTASVADERIIQRLECLAMGDMFSKELDKRDVEVDVREALTSMGLPLKSEGARQALVKIGRWTGEGQRVEPWSSEILDAARWYSNVRHEQKMADLVKNDESIVDLRKLPCICVDQKKTSFRDDAVGLRLRSTTGRNVIAGASKWEILIHIADVSDIFCAEPSSLQKGLVDNSHLLDLRKAARMRGSSRFDLPLGPLHLMPPTALRALALKAKRIGSTGKEEGLNRCVTVWVYLDAKDGNVLESGVERSVIRTPLALSYAEADSLMQQSDNSSSSDSRDPLNVARSILLIAEKHILAFKSAQLRTNTNDKRKHEQRRHVRELVSNQIGNEKNGGFQRGRGHQLVDGLLDTYARVFYKQLKRARAPIPTASGAGLRKGGRVGTAPLRRYIDCLCQRQGLSVLCNYGGPPMTIEDCKQANQEVDDARNRQANWRPSKEQERNLSPQQIDALRGIERELHRSSKNTNNRFVAIGTGRQNEVVMKDYGALARCQGIKGNLAGGKEVHVSIKRIDVNKGVLIVELDKSNKMLKP